MASIPQEFIETILNMHESDTLDFKRDQYPFEGAGNEAKGELLKDILAFANAWNTSDAHILIGAEEVPGERARVVGLSRHLDDAKVQQFVNSKTNTPVRFCYIVSEFEEKSVGVIRISRDQRRPIFLNNDFGRLRRGAVYIRRGSSTDEARPDEIVRMGSEAVSTATPSPNVELGIGIPVTREKLKNPIQVHPRLLVDPPPPSPEERAAAAALIRQWAQEALCSPRQIDGHSVASYREENASRTVQQQAALLVPLGFYAKNVGQAAAHDVRAEVIIPKSKELIVVAEPDHPRHTKPRLAVHINYPPVKRNDVFLKDLGKEFLLELQFGKVQPQAECWLTDVVYVGATSYTEIEIPTRTFADNMSFAVEGALVIQFLPKEEIYVPKKLSEL